MLLRNASALLGKDLTYVQKTDIKVAKNIITRIEPNLKKSPKEEVVDCEGLLLVPGFINSHTHIGDSIAKDVFLNSTVDQRIHPVFGIKSKILKKTKPSHLISFMRNSCCSMVRKGITTFVDFREGGLEGLLLAKEALKKTPIRSVILGRLEHYQSHNEVSKNMGLPKEKYHDLEDLLKKCDGIGVSGANENSNSVLNAYSSTSKLRAIHSSETLDSVATSIKTTGKSETFRALKMKPHFLVHMTFAEKKDLMMAARKTRGIVICPRANAALAEGIPDIELMRRCNCNLAIGTDNVMINSPDMFREMDYLWKVSMALHKKRIDPRQILKMATVNAGKILRKNIGVIQKDNLADFVFLNKHSLDLDPLYNPYAAIIHRASESTIRAIMIDGEVVHGKI